MNPVEASMNEHWKPISGFEGYEVSDHGRVRSLDRNNLRGNRIRGRVLRPRLNGNGYPYVNLYRGGKLKTHTVHRLVALAFLPSPAPEQDQVNHINGKKDDSRAANLEWCSASENTSHAYKIGLASHQGEKNTRAVLNDSRVQEIFRLAHAGERRQDIADSFSVSGSTVSSIKNGRTWKHVTASLLADLEAGD